MTFTEYKADPKVGTRSYRGINLTLNQLFITAEMSRECIGKYALAVIGYDKNKAAIRLTLTNSHRKNGLTIRSGVSYAHYIPCNLAHTEGMPTGRYYVESTEKKDGDTTLIFIHAPKK